MHYYHAHKYGFSVYYQPRRENTFLDDEVIVNSLLIVISSSSKSAYLNFLFFAFINKASLWSIFFSLLVFISLSQFKITNPIINTVFTTVCQAQSVKMHERTCVSYRRLTFFMTGISEQRVNTHERQQISLFVRLTCANLPKYHTANTTITRLRCGCACIYYTDTTITNFIAFLGVKTAKAIKTSNQNSGTPFRTHFNQICTKLKRGRGKYL